MDLDPFFGSVGAGLQFTPNLEEPGVVGARYIVPSLTRNKRQGRR